MPDALVEVIKTDCLTKPPYTWIGPAIEAELVRVTLAVFVELPMRKPVEVLAKDRFENV